MNDCAPYCSVDIASELIACCLEKNVPFYVCRYPGEELCRFGAQLQGMPYHGVADGFRVVPFDIHGNSPVFTIIPDTFASDIDVIKREPIRNVKVENLPLHDTDYESYIRTVESLVQRMQAGELSKVVLSRTITRPCDTKNFLPHYFVRLSSLYPSAYVFIVVYPGVCQWIGATPEVLLSSQPSGYATMALAGTRPVGTTTPWGSKEREEQDYVTRYITDILQSCGMDDVRVHTYTKQAAQVEHLCSHFDIATSHQPSLRDKLLQLLHPTPAVAGTPTRQAMQAIVASELHDRRYYGGYLGEATSDGRCGMFVNLRSMEFDNQHVRLYVGGGLTSHSVARDEWNETCAKSQTLLSAFQ